MDTADPAFLVAFDRLPHGTFRARFEGQSWVATRSAFSGGRSEKLVAEALGGNAYVSMNLYHMASGSRVAPCEMPFARVRAFVLSMVPDG